MKYLALVFVSVLVLMSGAPLAYAANIPVLDSSFHIVPDAHDLDPLCPVGAPLSYGAVLDTIQRGMNAAISFGILIFVIMMAWAGLQFIMSVTNPEARSHARGMLLNAAVGLLIVLSAWLIVDFVMKTLYSGSGGNAGKFGPWNSLLNGGSACIIARATKPLYSGGNIITTIPQGTGDTGTTGSTGGTNDGFFTYQAGVQSQKPAMSSELASLLSCMAQKLPSGVGQISALTDKYSGTDTARITQCAKVGKQGDTRCAHTVGSCHYGGTLCAGKSYAADFGDEQNRSALIAAARACGAVRAEFENGNHVHVSAPNQCGVNASACN